MSNEKNLQLEKNTNQATDEKENGMIFAYLLTGVGVILSAAIAIFAFVYNTEFIPIAALGGILLLTILSVLNIFVWRKDINTYENRLIILKNEIKGLKNEIKGHDRQMDSLKTKIEEKNKKLEEIKEAFDEKDSEFHVNDEKEFENALRRETDEAKNHVNEMIDKNCKNLIYKYRLLQEETLKETQKEKEHITQIKKDLIENLMEPYTLYHKRLEDPEFDAGQIEYFITVIEETINEIFASDGETIVPEAGDPYDDETMEISSSGNKAKEGSGLDLVVRERKKVGYQFEDFTIRAIVSVEDPKPDVESDEVKKTEETSTAEIIAVETEEDVEVETEEIKKPENQTIEE